MKQSLFEKFYLVFVLILMYVPMLLVVIYSFNGSNISTVWDSFSLKWYAKLFLNREMGEALKNSLIIAGSVSLLSAFFGTVAAVGIHRSRNLIDRGIKKLALVPLMMPEIISGILFLLIFTALGIKLGAGAIIIAHSSFCIPYVFMTVNTSLSGLDISTEEAARDLGASPVRTFFTVTVPQIMPGIISGTLLSFAMSMDDVVISFFVTGPKTNTLPVKIYSQLKKGVTPEVNALCSIMILVSLVIVSLAFLAKKRNPQKSGLPDF